MIFIPYQNYLSGPRTFLANMKKYLEGKNYPCTDDFEQCQVIFFPISYSRDILKKIKDRGGKIVQRLDGIYYPSKHGDKHVSLNREIKEIYLMDADYIVFQSQYSREQCFSQLGIKKVEEYSIILNGVDKKIFYPFQERGSSLQKKVRFITTGFFRNPDMIEPVIRALDHLKPTLNFELIVAGALLNKNLSSFLQRDYLQFVGSKSHEEVAALLRESDIYLYSHLNPPCPNSVLEALSCGLPVVSYNSGSMPELLFFGKDLLAPVSEALFQEYQDFKYEKLAEKIMECVGGYSLYKERAREYAFLYPFEECGEAYIKIFDQMIERGE